MINKIETISTLINNKSIFFNFKLRFYKSFFIIINNSEYVLAFNQIEEKSHYYSFISDFCY